MQNPPELFSKDEERQIAEMIETDIDHALEQKNIHEVVEDNEDDGDLRSVVR